jgi:L-threonylcarbamoyladenylate synthase
MNHETVVQMLSLRDQSAVFRSRFLLSRATQFTLKRKTCTALQILSTGPRGIEKAASIVMKGGIVAYPTDTVYGLGCDPTNSRAVKRVMAVKGKRRKPFPILVASQAVADRIAVMDPRAKLLASKFWPGPLTLVLKPRVRFPNSLTLGRKTIAVRCPDDQVALRLIERCGGLLTGTSANLTGHPPCTSARMVLRSFGDRIDAAVDGGRSPRRVGSTIVRIDRQRVTIVRQGPIRNGQVKRALSGTIEPRERR